MAQQKWAFLSSKNYNMLSIWKYVISVTFYSHQIILKINDNMDIKIKINYNAFEKDINLWIIKERLYYI